jgi:hypothetical protein
MPALLKKSEREMDTIQLYDCLPCYIHLYIITLKLKNTFTLQRNVQKAGEEVVTTDMQASVYMLTYLIAGEQCVPSSQRSTLHERKYVSHNITTGRP